MSALRVIRHGHRESSIPALRVFYIDHQTGLQALRDKGFIMRPIPRTHIASAYQILAHSCNGRLSHALRTTAIKLK